MNDMEMWHSYLFLFYVGFPQNNACATYICGDPFGENFAGRNFEGGNIEFSRNFKSVNLTKSLKSSRQHSAVNEVFRFQKGS